MTSTTQGSPTPELSGNSAAGSEISPPPGAHEPASIRVRYFAGARAAAGVAEEVVSVTSASAQPVTAADVIEVVLTSHGPRLAEVVPSCSFLLNGVAVRDRSVVVPAGAELDVLPPFAGG